MGTQEIARTHTETWSPKEVIAQIQAIQHLMKEGMEEGEHWGKIPGCGDKPALLKPGAEKLGLMFRLAAKYDVQEVNLPNGHLDVKVKCSLYHIVTGQFWGEGIGSCSTMESKYRYRTGKGANTSIPVPKNYWDLKRFGKYKEAQDLLGTGYTTEKIDGTWFIVEKIDKVENTDIADTYNTVRKISKKRSYVDAMLSATAASDIFTQDIDETVPAIVPTETKPIATIANTSGNIGTAGSPKAPEPQPMASESPRIDESSSGLISHGMALEIIKQLKDKNIGKTDYLKFLKDSFGIGGTNKIKISDYETVIEWIIRNEKDAVNG